MKQTETTKPATRRRPGLSREGIVARALEIGNAEGLDAVSLRRLASDFAVTPMALYRHVKDKQDLINGMTDAVLGDFDLSEGIGATAPWTEQVRRAMLNYREQMDARPLALPLSIAYRGDNPASLWRMLEVLLAVFLGAGFERRQAIVLIRVVSNLLAGYLLLHRQDQLSLPREQFPNLVDSAEDLAEVWLTDPDRWWRETVDLITLGLEQMLERSRGR